MRIFLFIINGLGVGSLPDYSKYDSEYHCTSTATGVIDECTTFNKLGLSKCCLRDMDKSTIGYCFRGRWLTNDTTFESGLNEILGNISFNNNLQIKENLISFLRRHKVKVTFSSSRENSIADEILDNDNNVLEKCLASNFDSDQVVIAELNDFAKFGFVGDITKMQVAIENLDDKFGSFIDNLSYDDIVFICGNFGISPSKIGITREYSPIFVYSKLARGNVNLKTIQGGNSIALTIVDLLNIYPNSMSFLDDGLRKKLDNNFVVKFVGTKGKVKELKPKSTSHIINNSKQENDKNRVIKAKIVKDKK